MKSKYCINLLLLAIGTLFFFSCSHNKPIEPVQDGLILPTKSITVYNLLDLPAWLLYPKDGNAVVGIGMDSEATKHKSNDSALKFAEESFSLNHGSFSVDKEEVIKYSEQHEDKVAMPGFKVELIPDAQYLEQNEYQLKSIAETSFDGYRFYLMGTEDIPVNKDIIKTSAGKTPEWCLSQSTKTDDDFVYVVGTGEDISLINAWKKAQENALKKIAVYRLMNSMSTIQETDDIIVKEQIIDRAMSNFIASFAQNWLYNKSIDGVSSYNVFIMLKAKK